MSLDERVCLQRIRQVFDYLKALNDHRNPTVRHVRDHEWSLSLDDLPDHPKIAFTTRVLSLNSEGTDESESHNDAPLLRVRRPDLSPPPSPPENIRDWLHAGWDDPFKDASVFESQNYRNENRETVVVGFSDDEERTGALSQWTIARNDWRKAEVPARRAMLVFERLYALHGMLEREAERFELIAGDGMLSWQQDDGNIYHPVLLQRVQLVFDAKIPEFTVVESDFGSELFIGLFQSIAGVDPKTVSGATGLPLKC